MTLVPSDATVRCHCFFCAKTNRTVGNHESLFNSPKPKKVYNLSYRLLKDLNKRLALGDDFDDWQILNRIEKRALCDRHLVCVGIYLKKRDVEDRIDSEREKEFFKLCNYWEKIFERVVHNILFIAKREFSF